MSIKYALVFGQPGAEYEYWKGGVCLGGIRNAFRMCFSGEYENDEWEEEARTPAPIIAGQYQMRQPRMRFNREDFRGIRLDLKRCNYWTENNLKKRRMWDDVHDRLLGHLIDGRSVRKTYDQKGCVTSIFYGRNTPMAIMMSSISVYRLWDNWVGFKQSWPTLDHLNLHPLVQYAACVHVGFSVGEPVDFLTARDQEIHLSSGSTHLPWHTQTMTPDNIKHMASLTRADISDWPTIGQQVDRSGSISYQGREAQWRTTTGSNPTPFSVLLPRRRSREEMTPYGFYRTVMPRYTKTEFLTAIQFLNEEVVQHVADNRT